MIDDFNERLQALFTAIIVTLMLLFWPQMAAASKTTLTGNITDSQGSGVNGTLVMYLPVPAQDTTTNTAVTNGPVLFNLVNGAISGGAQLYDTANLQPQGLWYTARAYDFAGNLVFNGNYVVTGGTFNLGAATPTSVTTSNISYLSPAAQNGTNVFSGVNSFTNTNTFSGSTSFTGAVTFSGPLTLTSNTITLNNSGVFTTGQMNEYFQSILNSCSVTTEYGASQAGLFATDGLSGCVAVPSGATVHQQNAVAGYANNSAASNGGGGAVGGYFQARALANINGAIWGTNQLIQDVNTLSGTQMIGDEIDVNVLGTPARVWGILINGASTGTMPALGSSAGIEVRPPGTGKQWPATFNATDASGAIGVNVGTSAGGNNVGSMTIQLNGRDGGGVSHPVTISSTPSGTLNLNAAVQKLNIQDKGQCTMAAGTCSAQTLNNTYISAPTCVVTWTGTGTLAGSIKVASSTTSVTPSSSTGTDTAVVNWVCIGS